MMGCTNTEPRHIQEPNTKKHTNQNERQEYKTS